MSSFTVQSTFYHYNNGWVTCTVGTNAGYISTRGNEDAGGSIQPIKVSPSTGYKITDFKFDFGLVGNSTSTSVTIYAYAFDTLAHAKAGYLDSATTGLLASGSASYKPGSSGVNASITLSTFNITAETTIYILLFSSTKYHNSSYLQYWTKVSGNVSSKPTGSITETPNGTVRIYNGSSWVLAIPYIYNGTEWKQAIPYVHNGTEWKICGG